MKITKLVHSCLLVEADNTRILVDPGNFSWNSSLITSEMLTGVDAVVITHAHPDHLYEDFVKAIHEASPDATWYGPAQVVTQLDQLGIKAASTSENKNIRFIESKHADLNPWFKQQPDHSSFVLFDDLLISGDTYALSESHGARIFGAAINGGPWGAVLGFVRMIEAMTDRPEVVIPLHDWHFNDEARQGVYARLPEVLAEFNVNFVELEDGVAREI